MAVKWNGQQIEQLVRTAAMQGVVAGTESIRNEAIRLILRTRKSGRVYVRRGIRHRASAPGEPPASDTGALVNRIETRYDHSALSGTVNFSAEYARHLEFGTQTIEPRPFARPAVANKRASVIDGIARRIARVLA